MGEFKLKTSFSSQSLLPPTQPENVYCCPFCILTFDTKEKSQDHQKVCLKEWQPPGREIYRLDECSFHLVDGKEDLAQQLASVGKAFVPSMYVIEDLESQ